MELIQITSENIDIALKIQNTIFPGESAYETYLDSINHPSENLIYWLLCKNEVPVGVSGLYSFSVEPESAWLGWFGILEKYRKKHYGSTALSLFEKYSREVGYLYVRLYTGRNNNDIAKSFYKANKYIEEQWECSSDSTLEKISIFSKSLYCNRELPLWNNRPVVR